jgi:hypothetical protein
MATKKQGQKGGPMDTRRLVADLPADLYKAVKRQTVELEVSMKDLVAEALRKHLGIKEGGESEKK